MKELTFFLFVIIFKFSILVFEKMALRCGFFRMAAIFYFIHRVLKPDTVQICF